MRLLNKNSVRTPSDSIYIYREGEKYTDIQRRDIGEREGERERGRFLGKLRLLNLFIDE